jgi:hypothetical protein
MKKLTLTIASLIAFLFSSQAQTVISRQVTHIISIDMSKDIHDESNFEGDIDNSMPGIDLSYNRRVSGKILEKGLSLGWQPIESNDHQDIINNDVAGDLNTRIQMFHAYGTLRATAFPNGNFQPYAEGIAGFKGVALTSKFTEELTEDVTHDINHSMTTWNLGYAIGLRWGLNDHLALDVRYLRVEGGELHRIVDVETSDEGTLNFNQTDWKAPVGYLRAGISFNF